MATEAIEVKGVPHGTDHWIIQYICLVARWENAGEPFRCVRCTNEIPDSDVPEGPSELMKDLSNTHEAERSQLTTGTQTAPSKIKNPATTSIRARQTRARIPTSNSIRKAADAIAP